MNRPSRGSESAIVDAGLRQSLRDRHPRNTPEEILFAGAILLQIPLTCLRPI
jgi:hypothetical protein